MRLDDGSVLIAGGYDNAFNLTATVIRYFPDGRILPQGPLSSPRAHGAMARTSIAGYPAAYASGLTDNALSGSVELFSTLASVENNSTLPDRALSVNPDA